MYRIFTIIVFILLSSRSLCATAQQNIQAHTFNYEQAWQPVVQPANNATVESIKATCRMIAHVADSLGDRPEYIKAMCWLYTLERYSDPDPTDVLRKTEKEILLAPDSIEKAIWCNITAKSYELYAEDNARQLYSRSKLKDTVNEDIRTWDMDAFQQRIRDLYLASVRNVSCFEHIPYTQFAAIINPGVNTVTLRRTLYDLLAADAITFLSKSHNYTTNAHIPFDRHNARYFAPASDFVEEPIQSEDTTNPVYQALSLYQNILKQNLRDRSTDVFTDFDLARLNYVYSVSNINNKDSLYRNALQQLMYTYPENGSIAQAKYLLWNNRYKNLYSAYYHWDTLNPDGFNLIAIHDSLVAITTKYPRTEGATNAINLVNQIEKQYIGIDVEQVNIPDKPIKALLSYQNRNEINISVYRIGARQYAQSDTTCTHPVYTTSQSLTNAADFGKHSIEINLGSYPSGFYAVALQGGAQRVFHYFQVNNILPVEQDKQHTILHRNTGYPLAAVAMLYTRDSSILNYKAAGKSRQDGSITFNKLNLPEKKQRDYYSFIYKQDTLIQFRYDYDPMYQYNYSNSKDEEEIQFLFTDRSIYRPGQTVWFKGIVFKKKQRNDYRVSAGQSVAVTFDDVSGNTVKELTLRTNEFGSFTGSFTVPETGLMGEMDIYTDEAEVTINVEEYKKPKFQIIYDTIKQQVYVGDTIMVKGRAVSFAGNPVDGATVKYTVGQQRQEQFIHYNDDYDEMFDSVTVTDQHGYFTVPFVAESSNNRTDDQSTFYQYEVRAEVTDRNGESRSKATVVKAGYTDIFLYCGIPQIIKTDLPTTAYISTYSINDVFIPKAVQLTIKQLQPIDRLYRKRLWNAPTDSFMSKDVYRSIFPDDAYGTEMEVEKRPAIATILDTSFITKQNSPITLNTSIFRQSGYYLVEAQANSILGRPVIRKRYVFILNPEYPLQFDNPLQAFHEHSLFQPGDTVTAYVYTPFKDVHILQANTFNQNYDLTKGGKIRQIIKESNRGAQELNWMFVRNGRLYEKSDFVFVPWRNKRLNIKMASMRNILSPGDQEEWTIDIERADQKKVTAEALAVMYDASLDELNPHSWDFKDITYPSGKSPIYWKTSSITKSTTGSNINIPELQTYSKAYPFIKKISHENGNYTHLISGNIETLPEVTVYGTKMDARTYVGAVSTVSVADISTQITMDDLPPLKEMAPNQIRSDFKETAFFIPQLKTDQQGKASFRFTVPESLTEWRMMLFAHSKDGALGYREYKVQTQKELMVSPNLPRVLRQGDDMYLTTKISNLTDTIQQGKAAILITDVQTGQNLNAAFGIVQSELNFTAAAQQSTAVSFRIVIPETVQSPVYIQLTAANNAFSDGEKHLLPVLPNRLLITETMPLTLKAGTDKQDFFFDALSRSKDSGISNQQLTVEYNSNPYWSAVQALPYLVEYPYNCTEQKFNKLFAYTLASGMLKNNPEIKTALRKSADTKDIVSPLLQNQELKTTMLSETPWMIEPKDAKEQKKQMAQLLDSAKMHGSIERIIEELQELQSGNGAFPWFKGMEGNVFVTQYVLTGLAKLSLLDVKLPEPYALKNITSSGLKFLDQYHTQRYFENQQHAVLNDMSIQYLYVRSLYPDIPTTDSTQKMMQAHLQVARQQWNEYSNYLQGMIATAAYHNKDTFTARSILTSLSLRAVRNDEMGMYWQYDKRQQWYEEPIATQAFLIRAYEKINGDSSTVAAMRTWLLRKKQMQHWGTTMATAEACYALLASPGVFDKGTSSVNISVGATQLPAPDNQTGYLKHTINATDIKSEMANITISRTPPVSKQNNISWGAVYWQYFNTVDSIKNGADTAPLSIDKKIYRVLSGKTGQELQLLTGEDELTIGDHIMVRLVIHTDRDMDYVHLKDLRAAGFEPEKGQSGYIYQDGTGYYKSVRDAATDFFFDRIKKGTWVITYPLIVNQRGHFASGIATIQCMYAPEFTSHTDSRVIKVK